MPEIVIYLGPTLDLETARTLLSATYLPPVKRGDLEKLSPQTQIVGVVDGVFHQNLAVSPKEIVALLDRGVRVYGAASIGALRAAETHTYGMIGVGEIFELYRNREIDADDEVAVAYDPLTNRAVSEPMVNIRLALKATVTEAVIRSDEADEVINELRKTYFPRRSYHLVERMCPALVPFLQTKRHDQKRDDAELLLRTIASLPC